MFPQFMGLEPPSDPPHQYQNQQDQEDQSDSTAGIDSPGFTVAPRGQGADQQERQDNDQDDPHAIVLLSSLPFQP